MSQMNFLPRHNGTEHLPLVPNIEITDPEARNNLLLLEWEGDSLSAVCLPNRPAIFISKKCANSPEGLAWTQALVEAVLVEWDAARAEWSEAEYQEHAADAFAAEMESLDAWEVLP